MSRQPLATWEMAEILIRSRKATAAEKERLRPLLATMTAKEGSQKIGWSSSLFIMQTWDRCYPREPVCPPYPGQSDYEFDDKPLTATPGAPTFAGNDRS